MKITDIQIHLVKLPARRDHNWASKMATPIGHHAILELTTDEGIVGWGEAPAGGTWGGAHMRYYGETPETVRHVVLDHLLPAIQGLDPLDISTIHRRMDQVIKGHPYAKAAVDIACYDAAGKALGVPVSSLLGGRHREGIEVAHSLGIMDLDRCFAEAEEAVAEGARTIKCKTGLDPERDVALVRGLRERLGAEVKIRVDGNEGYSSVNEAVDVTLRQEEYDILLCEQPVAGAEGLARVASRISSPVMADESAWTVHDILELDKLDAAACISLYVTKPGGLYRARQVGEVAGHLGIYTDIGGSIETAIGNAANLHLGTAMANAVLPSVCPVSQPEGREGPRMAGVYYLDDLVTEPFRFVDGVVMAPTGPGLGIEVDREKIARYTV
ncbi:mandelate racemase/muconate lactonizing enzyme family protein [Nocardioides marmoribigeumensis]|uniref:Muconate cycloisomerase n=1 Tax=Nocardioides marmoribigeumensis TaxID=433649 RepID=A0ABU2BVX8_9ACTN|nr:enolase C-terminal domain-like protein [Nocardioides marmoribigeumensis]MDR7362426.1 muconate cycloisomerase [Nocardioides marmoribigeumensis]